MAEQEDSELREINKNALYCLDFLINFCTLTTQYS